MNLRLLHQHWDQRLRHNHPNNRLRLETRRDEAKGQRYHQRARRHSAERRVIRAIILGDSSGEGLAGEARR
jgi:hypothetical protein